SRKNLEVLFLHPYQADSQILDDLIGNCVDNKNTSFLLLNVNGWTANEKMTFNWSYVRNAFSKDDITTLAQKFAQTLTELVQHSNQPYAGGFTPSDFPLAKNLTQSQIDQLTRRGLDIDDIYTLTAMQEGMFFHATLDPDTEQYITQ